MALPKNNAQRTGRKRSVLASFAAGFDCWLLLFCAGCYCAFILQQPQPFPLETFGPIRYECLQFGSLKFHFSCTCMERHAFVTNLNRRWR